MLDAVGCVFTRILRPSAGSVGRLLIFSASTTGILVQYKTVEGCGATALCCIAVLRAGVRNLLGPGQIENLALFFYEWCSDSKVADVDSAKKN